MKRAERANWQTSALDRLNRSGGITNPPGTVIGGKTARAGGHPPQGSPEMTSSDPNRPALAPAFHLIRRRLAAGP